jgi:hypothetical protein
MAAKWPTYLAWVYHHRLLKGAKRGGTGLLFTNGILLLIVSAVPFPTVLLGAFLTTPATAVVCATYAGYVGVLNLIYNLLWWEVMWQQTGYIGVLVSPTTCSSSRCCGGSAETIYRAVLPPRA